MNTEARGHGVLSCYTNYPFCVCHKNLIKSLRQNSVHGIVKINIRGRGTRSLGLPWQLERIEIEN